MFSPKTMTTCRDFGTCAAAHEDPSVKPHIRSANVPITRFKLFMIFSPRMVLSFAYCLPSDLVIEKRRTRPCLLRFGQLFRKLRKRPRSKSLVRPFPSRGEISPYFSLPSARILQKIECARTFAKTLWSPGPWYRIVLVAHRYFAREMALVDYA